jgi:LmbE family N-acetylglucosaminyl deacetylase
MTQKLSAFHDIAVVCAHPDDESFGLGAVLSTLVDAGSRIDLLCFTHGEASTLHGVEGGLAKIRAHELTTAAAVLGLTDTTLLDYPDGHLEAQTLDELADHIQRQARLIQADALLTFDVGGITGHPDHQQTTRAAIRAATELDITVLAWTLPRHVAETLNREFDAQFVGRTKEEIDFAIDVDRSRQLEAIRCHQSQSDVNPMVNRRLDLSGNQEHLRYLHRSTGHIEAELQHQTD